MKKIILLALLLTNIFPFIKQGKLCFGNEATAQGYSLEDVAISGWDRDEEDFGQLSYTSGYVIQEGKVTWTNPDNPSNKYSYPTIKIINELAPTYSNPLYNGNAMYGSNFIGPGPNSDPFSLGLDPMDELDRAAMLHDYAYYKQGIGGVWDAITNLDVRNADLGLYNSAKDVIDKYWSGSTDVVTGLPVSYDTWRNAVDVATAFQLIVESKYGTEF